jgi:hypothetical protein
LKRLITSIMRTGVAAARYIWVKAISAKRESTNEGGQGSGSRLAFYIIGEADD